jgi:hypothetical protein
MSQILNILTFPLRQERLIEASAGTRQDLHHHRPLFAAAAGPRRCRQWFWRGDYPLAAGPWTRSWW